MPVDGNAKTPKPAPSGNANASNIDANRANAAQPQSGEGDSRSAASAPQPSAPAASPGTPPANGQVPRRRGRRRIRERCQVRARLDQLAGKLERGEIDSKTAAVLVQCLNGVLSCLNAEKDEDFEKRLSAVEEKVSADKPPRKRGADA